jgi:hypothetical protein
MAQNAQEDEIIYPAHVPGLKAALYPHLQEPLWFCLHWLQRL